MKKSLLILCMIVCALNGSANSFTGVWGGGGLAKNNNFGLNTCGGFTYYFGIKYGIGIGATAIYQKYNLFYSDQQNAAAGTSVRLNGAYTFVAPTFVFHVVHSGQTQAYINVGAGFATGITDSIHRWSGAEWASPTGKYDSMIDGSKKLNSMVFRIGFGLTEYYPLGGNWRLAITEDVGLLPGPLGSYSEEGNMKLNSDMINFFKPVVFSLRLGITYRTPTSSDGTGRKKMSRH